MSRWSAVLLIYFSATLAGCTGTPIVTPSTPIGPLSEATVSSTVRPMPTVTLEPVLTTIPVPTPSLGLGVIHGQLIQETGQPIGNTQVRLGDVVWFQGQEGQEGLVVSERSRAPQTISDAQGNFVLADVSPGTYGLVVADPNSPEHIFVRDPTTGRALLIEVEKDKIVDLGKVVVNLFSN
jgi:hypothetical protein